MPDLLNDRVSVPATGAGPAANDAPPAAKQPIGETLVARGLISAADLQAALELQRKTGRRLGETLVGLDLVAAGDLMRVLAERLELEFVVLTDSAVDTLVAQSVPEQVARRYRALPIRRHDDAVVVVMHEPNDVFAIDDLGMLLQARIIPALAEPALLDAAIDRVWTGSSVEESVHDASDDIGDTADYEDIVALADEAPVVRMVNAIISRATAERASDVHLEPTTDRLRIRFRVDGVLHDASEAPLSVHRPAVSRLKIMAGIDIAKQRLPQDGRFSVKVNDRHLDVRVATLPTACGEAVVLRLLDKTGGVLALDALGMGSDVLDDYRAAFSASQGLVMTSGPTGSGKTSTLYATLLELDCVMNNVIAIEDPIEYRIDGIKQMQVNLQAGMTFPTALRSILRADPDVLLVGEIRDRDTALIASEASLTGHLVLSSIHTTSAAAVPLRLIDMGVEPFLVTSALSAVVGQRLVRRLCEECAEPYVPDVAALAALGIPDEVVDTGALRRPVGCPSCGHTGYHGRIGVYEVMRMSGEISRLVTGRADRRDIERWAVAEGMDTLRMSALRQVAEGRLSLDELARVIV